MSCAGKKQTWAAVWNQINISLFYVKMWYQEVSEKMQVLTFLSFLRSDFVELLSSFVRIQRKLWTTFLFLGWKTVNVIVDYSLCQVPHRFHLSSQKFHKMFLHNYSATFTWKSIENYIFLGLHSSTCMLFVRFLTSLLKAFILLLASILLDCLQ